MSTSSGPVGPSSAASAPSSPNSDAGKPFKIATVILAVTTVAALVWGIVVTKNYSDFQSTSQAQIKTLQDEVRGESRKNDEETADLAEARKEFTEVKANLKTEKADLNSDNKQLTQLRAQYDKAQKAAEADESNLKAQLAASQAKATLASHCAAVVVGSMEHLYNQLDIMTPEPVTFKEVAKYLKKASVSCKGVVVIVE